MNRLTLRALMAPLMALVALVGGTTAVTVVTTASASAGTRDGYWSSHEECSPIHDTMRGNYRDCARGKYDPDGPHCVLTAIKVYVKRTDDTPSTATGTYNNNPAVSGDGISVRNGAGKLMWSRPPWEVDKKSSGAITRTFDNPDVRAGTIKVYLTRVHAHFAIAMDPTPVTLRWTHTC